MGFFVAVLLVPFAYLLSVGALSWGSVPQTSEHAAAPVRRTAAAVIDPAARLGPEDESRSRSDDGASTAGVAAGGEAA